LQLRKCHKLSLCLLSPIAQKGLFDIFERTLIFIPKEEIDAFIEKAEKISPDPKDVPYFALALKLRCSLWSNDKALKEKQDAVQVYSTQELINMN